MRKAKKVREKSTFRDYFELIAETMIFVFFVINLLIPGLYFLLKMLFSPEKILKKRTL